MSEQPTSLTGSYLLPAGVAAELKRMPPEVRTVVVEQIAADAKHVRAMAWARLILAVLLFSGCTALSAYLAVTGAVIGGAVSAGSGTLTVVTILLTGKPPVIRPKKRPAV